VVEHYGIEGYLSGSALWDRGIAQWESTELATVRTRVQIPISVDPYLGGSLSRWIPVSMDPCLGGLLSRWATVSVGYCIEHSSHRL